jgi:uncharacterized protein
MEQPPPPQGNEYPPHARPVLTTPTREERTWAMLAHILPLPALSVFVGHILVPLIIWLLKREESPFIEDQAKEALNFQISYSLYSLVAGALIFACVGTVLLPVLAIAWVILAILATIRANDGIAYRYPLTIRFIR